jgi:hypothetical protein
MISTVSPDVIAQRDFAIGVLFHSQWKVQILCAMRADPVRLG